jgi:hypothetical protein
VTVVECTYCDSDLERYEPVFVEETENGERIQAGAFCNYGCLSAHLEAEDLAAGDACEWRPGE